MPKTQQRRILAPAGQLDAELTLPDAPGASLAVLCHPHPLYGGSMHDGVLDVCARALLNQGIAIARFNFRGVGTSAGISGRATDAEKEQRAYDPPEVGDLAAVCTDLGAMLNPSEMILVGYSFGAHVLWQGLPVLVQRQPNVTQAILVAPPTRAMSFTQNPVPASVDLHGVWCQDDDYVEPVWFANEPAMQTHPIAGGDHFFSAQDTQLSATVARIARGRHD